MLRTAALLISLTVSGNALAVESAPAPTSHSANQQGNQPTGQKNIVGSSPASRKIITAPSVATAQPSEASGQANQVEIETRISWAAVAEAACTFVLAIISGFLAWFTFKLWKSTRRLAISTRTLVKDSEKTAKKQLRAYVGVTEGNRDVIFSNSGAMFFPEVIVHLLNYGKIPASNLRCFFKVALLSKSLPSDFDFVDGVDIGEAIITLFPGEDSVLVCKGTGFTSDEMQMIRTPMGGAQRLFVYGHITYNDGFDDRKTNFCFFIWWRTAQQQHSVEKPGFYYYKIHNDAT